MPRISSFYGIVITMYYTDHRRAHFHAEYAEHMVSIAIDTFEVQAGSLPKRQQRLVQKWAVLHQAELNSNWQRARAGLPLTPITPLS
jgi:hypothetical protein